MNKSKLNTSPSFDFTVLMAVYKNDDPILFKKAIQSVLLNSLAPSRFLMVIDGPLGDPLEKVLTEFNDNPLVELVRLSKNIGLARALNAALDIVSTNYVIRADSDDINLPHRFQRLADALHKGYDLVGSDILEVTKEGVHIGFRKMPSSSEEIFKFARKRSPFNHMSVAFRKSVVVAVGGYPNIYLKEDYALWSTLIASNCRVYNIPEILVHATTGIDMYKRRGGFKYALSEIQMQKHLVEVGLKSSCSALIDGILRATIFLAPNKIRELIYLRYLRSSIDK